MLEVAEEACRAGDFDLAVEIYGSQLADLPQPDRGICLRKADALVRSGRIAEALDSYCIAAKLNRLRPEELGLLVENIALSLREKESDKWFDAESTARRYWQEGEHMWKKQDLSTALDKYNKAVELTPSDCILLTQRAELHMDMRSFSQALQDGERVCQLKPLWPKAHYLKATALNEAGQKEEALQEYLLCIALKPEWASVKLQAQKILSDMISSVFERDSLPTPLRPHQVSSSSSSSHIHLKPSTLQGSLHPYTHSQSMGAGSSKGPEQGATRITPSDDPSDQGGLEPLMPQPLLGKLQFPFQDAKSLPSTLSGLPAPPSLKRKHPCDSATFTPPAKLLKPVATPCGHTFCLKCLERCLDHNPTCPLCKENLSEYLATRRYNKTLLMEEVLVRYLLNQEVPIFVCTMAFPTIPCPLHVFEPRYRLMIRRSMETGTKQFGMCIVDELKGFADYGCMLEVRDVKFFPDGRSVVDTIGGEELAELVKLHDSVYDQATAWFTSLKENMKNQILSHFGNLPGKDSDPQGSPNGPAWCWWLLAVLPLENRAQLTILSMTSLKDRLMAVRRVLIFVSRKRAR
ncbi:hypothetical protein JZ751_027757 [Albula glossodonta]|uniref:LON peptidase N-terminal domain and RING finger protein 2 n=1 Tax=Albula glossodonta TaxID=121402 RepID=A0A8T2P9L0_9TELE|nr:hypothetical protein JZ751_027757 [Albula glossodonta]